MAKEVPLSMEATRLTLNAIACYEALEKNEDLPGHPGRETLILTLFLLLRQVRQPWLNAIGEENRAQYHEWVQIFSDHAAQAIEAAAIGFDKPTAH